MKTSEQINDLAAAMCQAQSEMKPAHKDSENPHFRSKYADLASVWDACRGPLTSHGLTVWQDVTTEERGVAVVTRITHTSGQWAEFGPLLVPLSKADAHGVGSAVSYGKRYALSAAVGVVADDDDDGNAAVKGKPQRDEARSVPRDAPKASGEVRDPDTGVEKALVDPPDHGEPDERERLLLDIKAMSDSLRLRPEQRRDLWGPHCGKSKPETAPIEGLRTLKKELGELCDRR